MNTFGRLAEALFVSPRGGSVGLTACLCGSSACFRFSSSRASAVVGDILRYLMSSPRRPVNSVQSAQEPATRMRRLRSSPLLRKMLTRVQVRRSDLILPLFVCDGTGVRREIPSMPGIFRMSVDVAADWLTARAEQGFAAYLAFGVIDRSAKDASGSAALDVQNVVCQLLRETRKRRIPMLAATDLCLCEYTDHGHCGPL